MKKFAFLMASIACLVIIFLIACTKDNNDETTLKIRLTDNPILAEEVNVDIQQVRVKFGDNPDTTQGWVDLNTNARIYNLLGLQNGVDTLLAVGTVPSNTVKEIRFILGSNNSIKVAGITYPLTIPSGSESGLKLKINKSLRAGIDSLTIDFDAALSIHQTGVGDYKLKPVLKIK